MLFAAFLAALPTPIVAQTGTIADSIVLERTLCYGTCPAYRLSISRIGEVRFESRNPGDSGRTASDRIAEEDVQRLTGQVFALGFFQFPDSILGDRALCPVAASDHPTVTVTVTVAGKAKRVIDYSGCYAGSGHAPVDSVARLRAFELAIDSVAGTRRWVRPARRR
jgi:hypothetical protein